MKAQSYQMHTYSKFRQYLDLLSDAGDNVVPLSVGYPEPGEFPLPNNVLSALSVCKDGKEKVRPGYGWASGTSELREALALFENKIHNTNYTKENVCMVAGATYGFNRISEYLFRDMFDSRDTLMIVAPTYYYMLNRVNQYAKTVSVVGTVENNFQITVEQIVAAIDSNTKAVFIANPTNPTYLYYSNEFFERLIPILLEKNIYLIIDESGDAFYCDENHNRFYRYSSVFNSDNVIRIVTASKKYLMAEYRIGYVLASKKFMGDKLKGFINNVGDDIGNAPLSANEALMEIVNCELSLLSGQKNEKLTLYESSLIENNKKMLHLKQLCIDYLKKCSNVKKIIYPDSNFNVTFSIFDLSNHEDINLYKLILDKANVSVLPCSGLGIDSKLLFFRISYAVEQSKLEQGMSQLCSFLESI